MQTYWINGTASPLFSPSGALLIKHPTKVHWIRGERLPPFSPQAEPPGIIQDIIDIWGTPNINEFLRNSLVFRDRKG